jgi:hypothetical protein
MSSHRRRARWFVLGAVVIALLACLAPSAYAGPKRTLDRDSVKVPAAGYDFGDGTMIAGGLTDSGSVEWKVDENDVTPVLAGELHISGTSDCARLKVDYYTSGTYHLLTHYGPTRCASVTVNEWDMDLSPFTSDNVAKVKVTLQRELSGGGWDNLGSDWSTLSTYHDPVGITPTGDDRYQFADSGWDLLDSRATGYGDVEWNFSGGQISPHLTGTLHLHDVDNRCARMRIDYWADDGALGLGINDSNLSGDKLATAHGNTVCADGDSHQPFSVDLEEYAHHQIDKLEIAIERQRADGSWTEVCNTISTFGS